MSARCPQLGLEGNRTQVYLVSSSRHRCYVAGVPQRVAAAHQAAVCLASNYRRCPRLSAAATSSDSPAPPSPGRQAASRLQAGQPGTTSVGRPAPLRAPAVDRPRYTDLRTSAGGSSGPDRQRRLTLTEGLVLSLVTCIVLATFFVGYVIFYRLRVGPGMEAPAVAAAGGATAQPMRTFVPTFTPTATSTPQPTPTATPAGAAAAPPTPIPEPTLPIEATASRPPASSPPTRLVVSSIDLDVPVRPVSIKTVGQGAGARSVWGDLPDAAAFHSTSAYPGNAGNTVINGHRDIYAAVFRHLDRVKVGDKIQLYVGEVAYAYQVTEVLIVPETFATAAQRAENQKLIGYLPEERLTLVTCTPVGLATHRLLVIARPPEEIAPQETSSGSGP